MCSVKVQSWSQNTGFCPLARGGHLRHILLGRLGGVDLKTKNVKWHHKTQLLNWKLTVILLGLSSVVKLRKSSGGTTLRRRKRRNVDVVLYGAHDRSGGSSVLPVIRSLIILQSLDIQTLNVTITTTTHCSVTSVMNFEQHVLYQFHPAQSDHDYNLRSRPHNLSLCYAMDHRNFITRLAFKYTY